MCGLCKDCKNLIKCGNRNRCRHFGNPWERDLTEGDGCSQFYEPKKSVKEKIDLSVEM